MPCCRSRWQFSLRSLFLVMTGAAVALAWWFAPFTLEERYPDGTLKAQFRVKRNWKGNKIACGMQLWYCQTGEPLGRQEIWDAPLLDGEFQSPGH